MGIGSVCHYHDRAWTSSVEELEMIIEFVAIGFSSVATIVAGAIGVMVKHQFSNGGVRLNADEQEDKQTTMIMLTAMGNDIKHIQLDLVEAQTSRRELRDIVIKHISDIGAHS